MASLESKEMPLRTMEQFYQPYYKEKSAEGLKVFPNRHTNTKQTVLTPKGQLPSVFAYLSTLSEARNLPRRINNKSQYYPVVKTCRKHHKSFFKGEQIQNEEDFQVNKRRLDTLASNHPSNRSIMVYSHVTREQKKIGGEKQKFRQTRSLKKEEKTKEMRFSFYNTLQKSDHYLKKFKEDTFLQQRRTNNYQNMFRRNITSENILEILSHANKKYIIGK